MLRALVIAIRAVNLRGPPHGLFWRWSLYKADRRAAIIDPGVADGYLPLRWYLQREAAAIDLPRGGGALQMSCCCMERGCGVVSS